MTPDDAETRFARDASKPAEAAEEREGEEQGVAEQIAAERGAD